MNGLDKDGVEDMRRYLIRPERAGENDTDRFASSEDISVLCDSVYEMEKGILQHR